MEKILKEKFPSSTECLLYLCISMYIYKHENISVDVCVYVYIFYSLYLHYNSGSVKKNTDDTICE